MISIKMVSGNQRRKRIRGLNADLLTELSSVVDELKKRGIPEYLIRDAVEIGLTDDKISYILDRINALSDKMLGLNEKRFKSYDEFMED